MIKNKTMYIYGTMAILCFVACFVGCDKPISINNPITTLSETPLQIYKVLPPGWTMQYNSDKTLWRIFMKGDRSSEQIYHGTFKDKQTAIDHAWEYQTIYHPVEIEWHDYIESAK